MGLFNGLPSCWLAFVQGLGWECEGLTVDWGSCCQWGMSCIPLVPPGWLKPLLGRALERIWVPPIGCALPPCTSPLVTLSITFISGAPAPHPVGKLWDGVVCPGLLLLLWEFGWFGVLLPLHPHLQSLSQELFCILEGLLSCPALVRAAMSLEICCPNYAVPSPESVATVALALSLSQISSLSLVGHNHQVWVGGSWSVIQVPDRVAYVLTDSMKEVALEVLVGPKVCRPVGALYSDLVEDPLQPHGERETFSLLPCVTL